MIVHAATLKQWYREPWPWLLMAGPAAVVLAGGVTFYLAIVSNDGIVADDYYKRGLAINQTLSRDRVAQQLNYRSRIEFTANFTRVTATFAEAAPTTDTLTLRIAHPTRPALDRSLPLTRQDHAHYAGPLSALTPGRWQLTLGDSGGTWRLLGELSVPGRDAVELAPR